MKAIAIFLILSMSLVISDKFLVHIKGQNKNGYLCMVFGEKEPCTNDNVFCTISDKHWTSSKYTDNVKAKWKTTDVKKMTPFKEPAPEVPVTKAVLECKFENEKLNPPTSNLIYLVRKDDNADYCLYQNAGAPVTGFKESLCTHQQGNPKPVTGDSIHYNDGTNNVVGTILIINSMDANSMGKCETKTCAFKIKQTANSLNTYDLEAKARVVV